MSAYKPGCRPASPRNHGDLPAHFLHLVPIKERRPLYPTTLTYRRMTSYLLTALRSHGVQHPPTSRKPNLEKGPLIDPADPSTQRRAWREASRDRRQLEPAHEYVPERPGGIAPSVPSMLPSGLLPLHTCFSPPPSEDHNICSPLPSVNIF